MAANSPQGDAGQGTIASIVTDRLPNQDATTGQTIAKVAQVMGLDPNANLTAGQIRRAQGLVQKYAASSAPASDANAGTLPPSANAGTPAPPASSAARRLHLRRSTTGLLQRAAERRKPLRRPQ
jgi:hypothetical protein